MPDFDDEEDSPRRPADELRRIARYHRWIVLLVLAQLTLWACCLLLSLRERTPFGGSSEFPIVVTVVLGCAGGIYSFLIYWTVRDPLWAVVMGLACIPPGMGLLVLAVVNGTATRELTDNGVKVGLLGADAEAIPDWPTYDAGDADDAGW